MQNLYAKGVNEVCQRHKCRMQNAKCKIRLPPRGSEAKPRVLEND